MRVLHSFSVLVGLYNAPPIVKRYGMEPKLFQGYLEWGIARSLSILFYELEYNMH
jgi:hypothetical protein